MAFKIPIVVLIWLLFSGVSAYANTFIGKGDPTMLPAESSLFGIGNWYISPKSYNPSEADIATFGEQLIPVASVNLKGGQFWYHLRVKHTSNEQNWVVVPNGSYIETVKVYVSDGDSLQQGLSGQMYPNNFVLNYGVDVFLETGKTYDVWVQLDSRYFSNQPVIEILEYQHHRNMVFRDMLIVIGCLGGIIVLALYNLAIFMWTRRPAYLYYGLYLISTFIGWCGVFGIFNQLFGVISVSYMMLPFYINVITNTFFYQRFLELKKHSPQLSLIGNVVAWTCFAMIFVSLFMPHWMRYVSISVLNAAWLTIGLVAGIRCLRLGYKPARFFVVGFAAVFIGGACVILPYFGAPRFFVDEYMVALVAQTIDVMFLALALADRINVLRKEKQQALEKALEADQLSNRVLQEANEKLLEALKVADQNQQAKDAFILSVSHELRTPLNAISGSLEQLKSAKESEFKELHQYIRFGADRLSAQVENILMLAETDQKELKIHQREFSIRPLIERITEANQSYLYQKDVDLQLDIEDHVPLRLMGDDHLLSCMIAPVVDNACKYTEKGKVSIGISVSSMDSQQAVLSISVEDTGPGISASMLEKIYEPFAQASTGYQRTHEGLGLGLSISQRIAKLIGAELHLTSTQGEGSCFRFEIPLARPAEHSSDLSSASKTIPHALIVEDNAVNAKVLTAQLKKLGLTMDIAMNGKEAAELPNLHGYDVIFMDLQMPIMDGFTATEKLREQGVNCPIIAVTANTDYQARIRCWDVGMNDFLGKPIRKERLQDTLGRWLKLAS